jgi:predicted phage-related endonuclease
MDKLYRNKKTGEIKPLPEKVYHAVRNKWEPAPEGTEYAEEYLAETISIIEHEKQSAKDPEIKENLNILQQVVSEDVETKEDAHEPEKESLQNEYEQLSGSKPDGRWSVKKLSEKIEELKGKQ